MRTTTGGARRVLGTGLLALVVAGLVPASAEAQLGGLKKKLKQAATERAVVEAVDRVAGPGSADAGAATGAPAASSGEAGTYVLPLSDAVLDRLERALTAEAADRAEVSRLLAALPSPEARAQCEQRASAGPAGQKILADYMSALEKAGEDQARVLAAAEAVDVAYKALFQKECGDAPSPERERELQQRPAATGAEAGGFTDVQYGILKERVVPFCAADPAVRDGGDVALPVPGTKHRYVYTAEEAAALAPRCAPLAQALASVG